MEKFVTVAELISKLQKLEQSGLVFHKSPISNEVMPLDLEEDVNGNTILKKGDRYETSDTPTLKTFYGVTITGVNFP